MNDITDFFIELLTRHRSIEIAEDVFVRMIADDDELKDEYRQWCIDNEHSEKHGFREFCEEYLEDQQSIWDTLNDYDE